MVDISVKNLVKIPCLDIYRLLPQMKFSCLLLEIIGNYYHFSVLNFGNFFAILPLDFIPLSVVK